jgi:hypothetical protein
MPCHLEHPHPKAQVLYGGTDETRTRNPLIDSQVRYLCATIPRWSDSRPSVLCTLARESGACCCGLRPRIHNLSVQSTLGRE